MNHEPDRESYRQAVEGLHQCGAEYVGTAKIVERFQGVPVWEGNVQTFALTDHPTAETAYAWSVLVDEESGRRRFIAVLREGPIETPGDAVRAWIAKNFRDRGG